MLNLKIIEIFTRLIPEGLGFILLAYIISRTQIDKNKLILAGLIHAVIVFFIRMLPIHFGVHTILSLMLTILILTQINKIYLLKSIISVLIGFVIMFICEWASFFTMIEVLKIPYETLFGDTITKILYSFPSLILFYLIILIIFIVNKKINTKAIGGNIHVND